MNTITTAIQQFISDEDGVTALEYGMIAALIAAVIVGTVASLGTNVEGAFTDILTALGG